ncbi:hypothetical protein Q5691_21620 [Microcoleus sp. w1-18aA5]|uniref:hypothetical protein n=1 Tax=Microcoleus sp. w1-18aA5 TaxID=2818982 RepID=UPI002FCEC22B
MLEFNQFLVVSFDCYGTLRDGERGILLVLRQLLSSHEIYLGKSQTRKNRILRDTAGQRPA